MLKALCLSAGTYQLHRRLCEGVFVPYQSEKYGTMIKNIGEKVCVRHGSCDLRQVRIYDKED